MLLISNVPALCSSTFLRLHLRLRLRLCSVCVSCVSRLRLVFPRLHLRRLRSQSPYHVSASFLRLHLMPHVSPSLSPSHFRLRLRLGRLSGRRSSVPSGPDQRRPIDPTTPVSPAQYSLRHRDPAHRHRRYTLWRTDDGG